MICSFIVQLEVSLLIKSMLKNKDFSLQFIRVLYLCGGHRGMTFTDWEEGRKAYLLSVVSPAQGQLNAANCML